MAESVRRKFSIFLGLACIEIEADEIQFAGPTMILWRDGACVAQFTQWIGWVEQGRKDGEKPRPALSVVTTLRPPDSGTASADPAA